MLKCPCVDAIGRVDPTECPYHGRSISRIREYFLSTLAREGGTYDYSNPSPAGTVYSI